MRLSLFVLAFLGGALARPGPASRPHSLKRYTDQKVSTSGCTSGKDIRVEAPRKNIFQSLTDEEYVDVTAYLHEQKELNLTAVVNSTSWDNVIVSLDILNPNKTDALAYLEGHGLAPVRYARATLQFNSQLQPYIQEYMVGPLPVKQESTRHEELNYMFTSGRGRINVYNADSEAIAAFNLQVGAEIQNITKRLLNGVSVYYFHVFERCLTQGINRPQQVVKMTIFSSRAVIL
jgi:primary-amine oxidase